MKITQRGTLTIDASGKVLMERYVFEAEAGDDGPADDAGARLAIAQAQESLATFLAAL